MAWSEFDDSEQQADIYINRDRGNGTTVITQITHGGMHITPALFLYDDIVWLAWVNRNDMSHYALHYAKVDAHSLDILEKGAISTFDDDVYAPTIAVDANHTPWIAWAGFDGNDEEIKIAHYLKDTWSDERYITQNDVPDSTPMFILSGNGTLLLSWEETTATKIITHQTNIATRAAGKSQQNPLSGNSNKSGMSTAQTFNPHKNLPNSLKHRQRKILMGAVIKILP